MSIVEQTLFGLKISAEDALQSFICLAKSPSNTHVDLLALGEKERLGLIKKAIIEVAAKKVNELEEEIKNTSNFIEPIPEYKPRKVEMDDSPTAYACTDEDIPSSF